MKKIRVRLTFTEGILGSLSSDPEIYKNYIASKAPNNELMDEEAELMASNASTDDLDRGITVFAKEDGKPFLYDYVIKGFFKNACSGLRMVDGTLSSRIKAYKKIIDNTIFIDERKLFINYEGDITFCERPLRGQTAQGERIALACSEEIAAGASIECTITTFVDDNLDLIKEWLNYGAFNGLGCWHNSGKGRFRWEEISTENAGVACSTKTDNTESSEPSKKKGGRKKKEIDNMV